MLEKQHRTGHPVPALPKNYTRGVALTKLLNLPGSSVCMGNTRGQGKPDADLAVLLLTVFLAHPTDKVS